MDVDGVDVTVLYWFFWTVWNRPDTNTQQYALEPSWIEDLQEAMNLSVGQLLFEATSLIMQMAPPASTMRNRTLISKERRLRHRATEGVKALLRLSDDALARRFLALYADHDRESLLDLKFWGSSKSDETYETALEIFDEAPRPNPASYATSLDISITSSNGSATMSRLYEIAAKCSREAEG